MKTNKLNTPVTNFIVIVISWMADVIVIVIIFGFFVKLGWIWIRLYNRNPLSLSSASIRKQSHPVVIVVNIVIVMNLVGVS